MRNITVPGDQNEEQDVFLRDLARGATLRVSVSTAGEEADHESGTWRVAIGGDGHCVAFESYATNLTSDDANRRADLFVRELP